MNADLAGLRVLVIGLNYAPEPTGIAPYTARMASGLARRGHQVRVLTTFPHYPQWRVDSGSARWSADDSRDGVPIRRLRHYVPSSPAHAKRALAEVTFGMRSVSQRWGHPDVVVGVSPALLSSSLLGLRATRSSAAWGLVVQDLYGAGLAETGRRSRASRALARVEGTTLRAADGIAVIHDRFKRRVVSEIDLNPDQVDVIRNWTHLEPWRPKGLGEFRARLGWSSEETVVLHTGAMGEKQALRNVVEAGKVSARSRRPIRFVLVGDGGQRAELEREAAGVDGVDILPPFESDDFQTALRAADVLLVNEKPGVQEMAVPSKLTSYFSAGRPVIAATGATSTTAEEVAAAGAGIRVDAGDPGALVTAVLRLREDPQLAREMGARGPAYCDRLLSEDAALEAYDVWVRKLYNRKRGESA